MTRAALAVLLLMSGSASAQIDYIGPKPCPSDKHVLYDATCKIAWCGEIDSASPCPPVVIGGHSGMDTSWHGPPGPEDRSWHLLQKQYDGLIRSIQSGLTKHECEFVKARVMGEPATDKEKAAEAQRASTHEKERADWLAQHPKCADSAQGSPECAWMGTPSSIKTRMANVTDIASAECFQ